MGRIHSDPARARLRILAAWVAGALVLAQSAGALHLLTVRHGRCAAHGELIDLERRAQHGAELAPALEHAGFQLEGPRSGDTGAHHHDHCALVSVVRARGVLTCTSLSDLSRNDTPTKHRAPSMEALSPQVARYSVAPKNSPPLAPLS